MPEGGMKEYLMKNLDPFRTALPIFILLLVNSSAFAQKAVPKFEIGAQFSLLSLQRPPKLLSIRLTLALSVSPLVSDKDRAGLRRPIHLQSH